MLKLTHCGCHHLKVQKHSVHKPLYYGSAVLWVAGLASAMATLPAFIKGPTRARLVAACWTMVDGRWAYFHYPNL